MLLGAVAALALVPLARADGDPASDYLLAQQVFLPFDAKIPAADAATLTGVIRSANAKGYKIRVALIWSDYDLGSVTSLWKQPRHYARFLGAELEFVYKQRLLVVMPNGFGFNWTGHAAAPGYAVLATVPLTPTPAGMAQAAATAVRKLAAAGGVTVSATAGAKVPASSTNRDRITIVVAVVGALLLGAALRLALRRR